MHSQASEARLVGIMGGLAGVMMFAGFCAEPVYLP
jgi:hypothetical protein